jgi:hypothetical protein
MKTSFLKIIILTVLTNCFTANGQSYGNIWHFANNVGLDFNGCTPVVITGSNTSFTGEGSSTICDASGQLLFYTNSDKVWNKNHNVMPNGNIFNTFGTLSQVIIVPKPSSTSLYYIITTPVQGGISSPNTLQYHVVDMTLNSGLGDVVSKNNVLNSNVTTEQVCATFHSNGTDVWIMTHEYLNNTFKSYLLTSVGITSTVVSSIGASHVPCPSTTNNSRGEIKFSPNGNKLAFNACGDKTVPNSDILQLFDFNKSNGVVSNPISLPYKAGNYGLSFSSDNTKLYCSTNGAASASINDSNFVYQFDLSSGNPTTIAASRTILKFMTPVTNRFGTLKLAPDGKIYVCKINSGILDIIDNPNLSGTSCNYITNGLNLSGKTTLYGLNNYIEYTNYCLLSAIHENNFESNLKFTYPNPADGKISIHFPDKNSNYSIRITDLQGKIIITATINNADKLELENDLNAGLYFLTILKGTIPIKQEKLIVD